MAVILYVGFAKQQTYLIYSLANSTLCMVIIKYANTDMRRKTSRDFIVSCYCIEVWLSYQNDVSQVSLERRALGDELEVGQPVLYSSGLGRLRGSGGPSSRKLFTLYIQNSGKKKTTNGGSDSRGGPDSS